MTSPSMDACSEEMQKIALSFNFAPVKSAISSGAKRLGNEVRSFGSEVGGVFGKYKKTPTFGPLGANKEVTKQMWSPSLMDRANLGAGAVLRRPRALEAGMTVLSSAQPQYLRKLAQEAPVPVPPEKKKTSLKRWMANTAIIGGSVAAGTAIGMITDKVISNLAGPKWQSMSQNGRSAVLMPAMAAAGIGTMVLGQKILREREEADRA